MFTLFITCQERETSNSAVSLTFSYLTHKYIFEVLRSVCILILRDFTDHCSDSLY